MTCKELLYVEDALAHGKLLQTKIQEIAGQLQDQQLKDQLTQMERKCQQIFQTVYGLL